MSKVQVIYRILLIYVLEVFVCDTGKISLKVIRAKMANMNVLTAEKNFVRVTLMLTIFFLKLEAEATMSVI